MAEACLVAVVAIGNCELEACVQLQNGMFELKRPLLCRLRSLRCFALLWNLPGWSFCLSKISVGDVADKGS